MNSITADQPKSRRTLLLVLLAFIVPVALAKLVLYFNLYHGGATNNGKLLPENLNYQSIAMDNPSPHLWQVIYLLPEVCDIQCQDNLYVLNQSHIALGREQARVVPVVMLSDNSDKSALSQMSIQFETAKASSDLIPLLDKQQMIIVDPLGSLVMQYQSAEGRKNSIAQGKLMIADLRKMLKLSRVG